MLRILKKCLWSLVLLFFSFFVFLGFFLTYKVYQFKKYQHQASISEPKKFILSKNNPAKNLKSLSQNELSKNIINTSGTKSHQQPSKRINTISGIRAHKDLLKNPISQIDLCSIKCTDLENLLQKSSMYSKVLSDKPNQKDISYELASLLAQATYGKTGIKVFETMELMDTANKDSFKKISFLLTLMRSVNEINDTLSQRDPIHAIEADALNQLLLQMSVSCTETSWQRDCLDLEIKIKEWISEGALI